MYNYILSLDLLSINRIWLIVIKNISRTEEHTLLDHLYFTILIPWKIRKSQYLLMLKDPFTSISSTSFSQRTTRRWLLMSVKRINKWSSRFQKQQNEHENKWKRNLKIQRILKLHSLIEIHYSILSLNQLRGIWFTSNMINYLSSHQHQKSKIRFQEDF